MNIKKIIVLITLIVTGSKLSAQLSGTVTVPGTYSTIAAAINDINTSGVNGPLVVNISAGYTEIAPSGGYTLTTTGTIANTITFQKNGSGANPLITAYTGGTGTPGSAIQDGIWSFVGCDYITIDRIDLSDANPANPATMEFGYGFFRATVTDGCQNNTVKNCVITLNRANNAGGTLPSADGSKGIEVVNATTSAHTTALGITAASGSNSNNKFYNNVIQNCNIGIALIGYADASPFTFADQSNDVGGLSATTSNTIINYGGATSPANAAAGVRTFHQYNLNVSFNVINNNDGGGVNHATTLRGIYIAAAASANAAITNNTVTVTSGAGGSVCNAIDNAAGSTAASNTITISNNVIQNCSYPGATSGAFNGIVNSGNPAFLVINNNLLTNNMLPGTGAFTGIDGGGSTGVLLTMSGNTVTSNSKTGASGSFYCMRAGSASLTVSSNLISNNSISNTSGAAASAMYGFYDGSTPTFEMYLDNQINNLSIGGAGTTTNYTVFGMYSATSSSSVKTFSGNVIHSLNIGNTLNGGFTIGVYHVSANTSSIYRNKIYNLSSGGATGASHGIWIQSGTNMNVYNNLIGDIKAPAASTVNPVSGIYFNGGTTCNVYYNTVHLNASSTGANFGSSALFAVTSASLNLRNNIFINLSTPSGTAITAAYRRSTATLTSYSATSNNNIFYAGSPGPNNLIMYDGTNSYQTLAAYQSAVAPRDAASFTENTPFLTIAGASGNFLHVNPNLPSSSESGAVNISSITDDYDGDIRQGNPGYIGTGTAPDIGADEYNQTLGPCSSASGGTQPAASFALCAGQTVSLSSVGASAGSGINYQWQVSTSAGGPYSNVSGGSGANTIAFTSGTLSAGTYYYVLLTTCASMSGTSNEATVVVNPIPTASISSNAPICEGLTLNLMGGSDVGTNFTWSGPLGFSSNAQNPAINNSISLASGTYSLLVSASNCSAAVVSASVTIDPGPTALSVTPTSASLCAGSSQTIVASGGSIPNTFAFGTQANQNTASTSAAGYPAPYTLYYGGQRMQMLILASELTAAGFVANSPITSIQFPVVSKGSNWGSAVTACQNFQVKIGSTGLTSLSAFQTGLTTVVAPMSFTPTVGFSNAHIFSSPFIWDGTSNVILETTFSNNITGGTNNLVVQYNSPTPSFTSTIVYRTDLQTAASVAGNTTVSFSYAARPDFKLNGLLPGSYTWSPSGSLSSSSSPTVIANPTSPTAYTVSSAFGTCSSNATVAINVVPVPVVSASVSSPSVCSGGNVTLTAVGATSYTWSTGALTATTVETPTLNTTYTVTGETGGCSDIATVSVTVQPGPTVNATSSPSVICSGQSATLTGVGATSYTWSTGALTATTVETPTVSTTYTVTGESGGCSDMATISLTVQSNPTVSATSSSSVSCSGQSTTLTAVGATSYTWSTGAITATTVETPTVTTSYTVTGESGGCTDVATISLTVNPNPVVSAVSSTSVLCVGQSATLTASGANTFTWSTGTTSISTVVSPTATTSYTVTGEDVNGCTSDFVISQTVSPCAGVEVLNGGITNIQIFPNPNNGILNINVTDLDNGILFELYDALGKVVFSTSLSDTSNQVDISELAVGIYSYRIKSENLIYEYGKLVRQ